MKKMTRNFVKLVRMQTRNACWTVRSLFKRSFISDGFSNWKHAVERFNGHEKSDSHRAAVSTLATAAEGVNVHSSLSKAKRDDMVSS